MALQLTQILHGRIDVPDGAGVPRGGPRGTRRFGNSAAVASARSLDRLAFVPPDGGQPGHEGRVVLKAGGRPSASRGVGRNGLSVNTQILTLIR